MEERTSPKITENDQKSTLSPGWEQIPIEVEELLEAIKKELVLLRQKGILNSEYIKKFIQDVFIIQYQNTLSDHIEGIRLSIYSNHWQLVFFAYKNSDNDFHLYYLNKIAGRYGSGLGIFKVISEEEELILSFTKKSNLNLLDHKNLLQILRKLSMHFLIPEDLSLNLFDYWLEFTERYKNVLHREFKLASSIDIFWRHLDSIYRARGLDSLFETSEDSEPDDISSEEEISGDSEEEIKSDEKDVITRSVKFIYNSYEHPISKKLGFFIRLRNLDLHFLEIDETTFVNEKITVADLNQSLKASMEHLYNMSIKKLEFSSDFDLPDVMSLKELKDKKIGNVYKSLYVYSNKLPFSIKELCYKFRYLLKKTKPDWKALTKVLKKRPQIASILANDWSYTSHTSLYPTHIFYIADICDDSTECREFLDELMKHVNWSIRDCIFDNTPLLWAIARGNHNSIMPMIEYIKNHPNLITMLFRTNRPQDENSCNTPLIMAIKNYDIKTALVLIDYYNRNDLMHLSTSGNSALHMAAFCGFNDIIIAMLKRAEMIGCREDLIKQKNKRGYTASVLYQYFINNSDQEKTVKFASPPFWKEPICHLSEEREKYQNKFEYRIEDGDETILLQLQDSQEETLQLKA